MHKKHDGDGHRYSAHILMMSVSPRAPPVVATTLVVFATRSESGMDESAAWTTMVVGISSHLRERRAPWCTAHADDAELFNVVLTILSITSYAATSAQLCFVVPIWQQQLLESHLAK
jgi:hypothetical protein